MKRADEKPGIGIASRSELNGRRGTVLGPAAQEGRLKVEVSGEAKKLAAECAAYREEDHLQGSCQAAWHILQSVAFWEGTFSLES